MTSHEYHKMFERFRIIDITLVPTSKYALIQLFYLGEVKATDFLSYKIQISTPMNCN